MDEFCSHCLFHQSFCELFPQIAEKSATFFGHDIYDANDYENSDGEDEDESGNDE